MGKVTEQFELYGKTYTLETGELAKQAGGAMVVRQGDTMVLVTATASKQPKDLDFFPLVSLVDRAWRRVRGTARYRCSSDS